MKYFSFSFLLLLFESLPIDLPIVRPDEEKPTFTVSAGIDAKQVFQDDFTIDLTITPSKSAKIKEVLKVGHNSGDYYYVVNPNTTKNVKDAYISQYTIPSRLYFDENGCYISLSFYAENGELYDQKGWYIKPVTPSIDIYPENYINTPYTAENIYTSLTLRSYLSLNETFQFPDYIDYFNIDVYHRLTLDSISFQYTSLRAFSYSGASLTYYDFDNVFPYIEHDNQHRISVPLSISMNNKTASFSYRDVMWVHPKTLQMSLTEKEGFVRTRHFYMPVNKKSYLLEEKMQITVWEAGGSKNDIHYELSYLASRDLIGDCNNSDYCVVEVDS